MTSYSPEVVNEILTILQSLWVGNCCVVATSTLVLYDQAVTLSRETEFIWGRKWSSVTLLFHLNRWTAFIWAVEQLFFKFLPLATLPSCIGYNDFDQIVIFLLYLTWAVFSGVRMYAISGRSWWLASVVCLLNMVPVGVNAYVTFAAAWFEITKLPVLGEQCNSGVNVSAAANVAFAITTRSCVILADVLLLLLTWMKTYAIYREAARNNVKTPLMALFLEDGTLYFIMLLSLNLLSVIGRITNIFIFTQSDFITPISSIITTHFLLNLRQLGAAPPDDSTNTTLAFASVQEGGQASSWRSRLSFNTSFVDNMGEDLVHTFDLSSSTHGVVPIEESNNEGDRGCHQAWGGCTG